MKSLLLLDNWGSFEILGSQEGASDYQPVFNPSQAYQLGSSVLESLEL